MAAKSRLETREININPYRIGTLMIYEINPRSQVQRCEITCNLNYIANSIKSKD